MAIKRCNGAIFEQVADIKQLFKGETVLLPMLVVRANVVKISKSSGKGYMASIVKTSLGKSYYAILDWSQWLVT